MISYGTEPILALAAIEEHLEGADGKAEGDEAEDVEAELAVLLGLRHEGRDDEEGQRPHRHVDVEDPAPAVIVRQPAAQHGAQDRPHHDAEAPDGHGRAMLLPRVVVEQRRLREGHQCRAEGALQQAEDHRLVDRHGDGAEHRGDGESRHRDEIEPLAPEAGGEPSRRRCHDGGGDDIGGEDPGDLILGRREGALHMGQGDIGDGGVQRLHDGRQHGPEGDQPDIMRLIGRRLRYQGMNLCAAGASTRCRLRCRCRPRRGRSAAGCGDGRYRSPPPRSSRR